MRKTESVRAVVNVTSDKCYENREWIYGYREIDPLGGFDPYSSSKWCAELVTSAYGRSYFSSEDYGKNHSVAIASARAGNVIGGGDWALDRLVPDCIQALLRNKTVVIRNPSSVRPWQHVLEPLSGYLLLAGKLFEEGPRYSGAWNFGPDDSDTRTVEWLVGRLCAKWGGGATYRIDDGPHPHEAHYLRLDCSKAKAKLGWHPRWDIETAIDKTIECTKAYAEKKSVRDICLNHIEEYISSVSA